MKTIYVDTDKRNDFVEITSQIQGIISKSDITDGICVVYCPHTTAGLTINENADPDVTKDILNHLEKLVPNDPSFAHSEGNSDSHIKSSLMGSSVTVFVKDKKLFLGTWQGIYFCEFDGPRQRKVHITIQ